MHVDFETLSPSQRYGLMTQTIVPRPIAWILSDNGDHSHNLAPFSYFNAICSDPPLIVLSIGWKDAETKKDTWINIEQRRYFVVHIAHEELLEPLNQSSATRPHGESEIRALELRTVELDGFTLPRLADARVALGCEVFEIRELGPKRQGLILGTIRVAFIDDEVAARSSDRVLVDAEKLNPLSRLGPGQFSTLNGIIKSSRPD